MCSRARTGAVVNSPIPGPLASTLFVFKPQNNSIYVNNLQDRASCIDYYMHGE